MKTPSLLALPFTLVLASMVASTIACSQPSLQPYDNGDDEDESSGASTKKSSSKSSTNKSSGSNTPAPPPTGTTPPPPPTGTTPPAPAPTDDPEACMTQCLANGPAAQYWQCSATCQDQRCDDNCWFGSVCGQQENACIQALDTCDQQCGFSAQQGF